MPRVKVLKLTSVGPPWRSIRIVFEPWFMSVLYWNTIESVAFGPAA